MASAGIIQKMMRRIVLVRILLFLAAGIPQSSGQTRSADKIQIISTGHITSIDAKKNSLKVSDTLPVVQRDKRRGEEPNRSRDNRRRPADSVWDFPGVNTRGEDSRFPGTGSQQSEYKVFVTGSTILKESDKIITLSDLKVGDHVVIHGFPKGNDIEATEISRKSQDSPDAHPSDSP